MPVTTESRDGDIAARNGHAACVMCGTDNPWSLGLAFEPDGKGGVAAVFRPHARLQGYGGILHGGVSAALLDSAMTHCLFHRGVRAVTADLRVRYVHEVPYHMDVRLRAWVVDETPPLYRLKAELASGGRVLVWAQATFCLAEGKGQS